MEIILKSRNRLNFKTFLGVSSYLRRCCSSAQNLQENDLFHFMGTWPPEEKSKFLKDMKVIPNFITDKEEHKTSRYNFTHEILAKEGSIFKDKPIVKGRRISIICRNDP
uniref:Uncharacterized protein n=1 Tax=Megaselia scalaris TaxID=36166 RepID=T1GNA2_MEGSC